MSSVPMPAELARLAEDARREKNWKRWGPYLAERQWATVREDYSASGDCWEHFPHDHARSRAYRWGDDGLLGLTDRECRLCFAPALWNGRDPILKERLFGVGGPEGNHGEDVKECYFYLDATPTHSYGKALYKYPQVEFPYARLVEESRRRGRHEPEIELADLGVFDGDRYFDVVVEYAKAAPNDLLLRITVTNRGPEPATIHVLPQIWFRNTWSWARTGEGYWPKPRIERVRDGAMIAQHASLASYRFEVEAIPGVGFPPFLFTENETNAERLWGVPSASPFVKDAFHERVVGGREAAVNPAGFGTKAAAWYRLEIEPGHSTALRLRLHAESEAPRKPFGRGYDEVFATRIREADEFYETKLSKLFDAEERKIARQSDAGLLWSKQFYHYVVGDWIAGDPGHPPPPDGREEGRNADWPHFHGRDVLSMPDKWEYPWFAAWDLAFHTIPLADLDPAFAKEQLVLLLREWYMHPNGQIPAYEFAFGDVNPPVHAWAAWRVYKTTGARGERDRVFLSRVFQKLLINFTWWVNRKDVAGKHIFSGGFLGLDNIGVFDRSRPLPTGGHLEQARDNAATEDVASKFFEHFIAIADAMNRLGGTGLWDETDGFYYDQLHVDGRTVPLRIRSMVGIIPLFAVEVLEEEQIEALPGFFKRLRWFLENRRDLAWHISYMMEETEHALRLLAIPSRDRLERVLRYVLDENEFLSPHGVRSLSRVHAERPFVLDVGGNEYRVDYVPGESTTGLFGGNSNWRGPVWFPLNYLLIESLERYHRFYGEGFRIECPTGSGRLMNLGEVAQEIAARLAGLFLPDETGRRPCHGADPRFATDPAWKDLLLFHEYFHGDDGRGCGAAHQTGWTALAVRCLEDRARRRRPGT
jgi:hypothetical protein